MKYIFFSSIFILAAVPSCEDEIPPLEWECGSFQGLTKSEALEMLSWNPEYNSIHSELWTKYGEPVESWSNFTLIYTYGSSGKCLKMNHSCQFSQECD